MSVSEAVRREVCERENIFNPSGYQYHHAWYRSEFFDDIDGAWNGEPVISDIHACIHNPGNQEDAEAGHQWEIFYKERALERYTGKRRKELEQIIKRKKIRYGL